MNKKELIELHFKGATELYKSELIEKEDYYIFANSLIDDCYWNMGILKNFNSDINLVWDNIKKELESRNRKPVLYIIPSDNFEISNDFELLYKLHLATCERLDHQGYSSHMLYICKKD